MTYSELPTFQERILALDTAVAMLCAALHVPNRRSDRDAMIATTALVHAMTVVTRNTTDFASTGVPLFDPRTPAGRQGVWKLTKAHLAKLCRADL